METKETTSNHKFNNGISKVANNAQRCYKDREREVMREGPYGKMVLLECTNPNTCPFEVLTRTTKYFNIPFQIEYSGGSTSVLCQIFVNGRLLSSSCGSIEKKALKSAAEDGYNILSQMYYALKIKPGLDSDDPVIDERILFPKDTPVAENVGSKMMRAMGWTGGGLGKNQQGIQEPVRAAVQIKKEGLGLQSKSSGVFRDKILNLLTEYISKNEMGSLTFSSDFTNEDRKIIHRVCALLKLRSRSYGKGENRQLVVSQNNFHLIIEKILSGEYSDSRYQLIEPCVALPSDNKNCPQTNVCENNVVCKDAIVSPNEPCTQVPKDQPPGSDVSCKNISSDILKPTEVAVQNDTDRVPQISTNVITRPFGNLVLLEDETIVTPIQFIERSANGCHIPFKFEYSNVEKEGMVCKLFINKHLVASSTAITKKRAREMTLKKSIVKLKNVCSTVKIEVKVKDGSLNTMKCLKKPNKLSGAYDKDSDTDIVCDSKEVNRTLFGMDNGVKAFSLDTCKDRVRNFLQKYRDDSCPYDLIFSPEFSAQEKTWIQKIASNLGLKITLYDVAVKEYMVINNELSIIELAKALLASSGNVSKSV